MKKYKLSDDYEGIELLGSYDDMQDVVTACKLRDEDTDGEWSPLLTELDSNNRYVIKEDWSY